MLSCLHSPELVLARHFAPFQLSIHICSASFRTVSIYTPHKLLWLDTELNTQQLKVWHSACRHAWRLQETLKNSHWVWRMWTWDVMTMQYDQHQSLDWHRMTQNRQATHIIAVMSAVSLDIFVERMMKHTVTVWWATAHQYTNLVPAASANSGG